VIVGIMKFGLKQFNQLNNVLYLENVSLYGTDEQNAYFIATHS